MCEYSTSLAAVRDQRYQFTIVKFMLCGAPTSVGARRRSGQCGTTKEYTSTYLAIGTATVLIDGLGPGYQCDYGEDVIADDAVSAEHEEERH